MNVSINADGTLACPDCGWTTSPDAANPRRSLSIHASHCTGVLHDSPNVLRGGRWVPRKNGVRVWVPNDTGRTTA